LDSSSSGSEDISGAKRRLGVVGREDVLRWGVRSWGGEDLLGLLLEDRSCRESRGGIISLATLGFLGELFKVRGEKVFLGDGRGGLEGDFGDDPSSMSKGKWVDRFKRDG
jgi:hypothetical protein